MEDPRPRPKRKGKRSAPPAPTTSPPVEFKEAAVHSNERSVHSLGAVAKSGPTPTPKSMPAPKSASAPVENPGRTSSRTSSLGALPKSEPPPTPKSASAPGENQPTPKRAPILKSAATPTSAPPWRSKSSPLPGPPPPTPPPTPAGNSLALFPTTTGARMKAAAPAPHAPVHSVLGSLCLTDWHFDFFRFRGPVIFDLYL